jgi:hypothetical protein
MWHRKNDDKGGCDEKFLPRCERAVGDEKEHHATVVTGSAGRTYRATRFILGNASETAMGKIPKTRKDTAPYDSPAYAMFSDDDVASISKFIQTGFLQMLR